MSIFVVGPVNGYLAGLDYALDELSFDSNSDQLWFSGNVIGDGPDNVALLTKLKAMQNNIVMVMGRQEFLLLAMAEQVIPVPESSGIGDILVAEQVDELLGWLIKRPFMHCSNGNILVHGGLPAEWSYSQALTFALELDTTFASTNHRVFLENMMKAKPAKWNAKLHGWMRARFLVNAFTRMAYTGQKARNLFDLDPDSADIETDLLPWYCLQDRAITSQKIITARSLKSLIPCPRNIIPVQQFEQRDKLNIICLEDKIQRYVFEREPQKAIV